MSEPTCCDLPDLVKTANPLPWTTGGPNDHSKPQQTASSSPLISVVDPVYYLKQSEVRFVNPYQQKQFLSIIKLKTPKPSAFTTLHSAKLGNP